MTEFDDLPDYKCPHGHLIPEKRFSRKLGCIILTCPARKRAKPAKMSRLDREDEEERDRLERKALRGVGGIPSAERVPREETLTLTAWPAELTIVDDAIAPSLLALVAPKPRDPDAIMADHLKMIVERLETMIRQRDTINELMRDVRAFAKSIGLNPQGINAVIKMRAQDKDKRFEFEAVLDVYRHVLGVEGPDFAVRLPPPSVEPPRAPQRVSARERAYRETLLVAEASQMAERSLGLAGGLV